MDKPAGVTSHDVVSVARRALGEKRIGHGGTLDPFATGLLVLLVGRATRLLPHLPGEPKVYEAVIRFGAETETEDLEGSVSREAPSPRARPSWRRFPLSPAPSRRCPPRIQRSAWTAGARTNSLARARRSS